MDFEDRPLTAELINAIKNAQDTLFRESSMQNIEVMCREAKSKDFVKSYYEILAKAKNHYTMIFKALHAINIGVEYINKMYDIDCIGTKTGSYTPRKLCNELISYEEDDLKIDLWTFSIIPSIFHFFFDNFSDTVNIFSNLFLSIESKFELLARSVFVSHAMLEFNYLCFQPILSLLINHKLNLLVDEKAFLGFILNKINTYKNSIPIYVKILLAKDNNNDKQYLNTLKNSYFMFSFKNIKIAKLCCFFHYSIDDIILEALLKPLRAFFSKDDYIDKIWNSMMSEENENRVVNNNNINSNKLYEVKYITEEHRKYFQSLFNTIIFSTYDLRLLDHYQELQKDINTKNEQLQNKDQNPPTINTIDMIKKNVFKKNKFTIDDNNYQIYQFISEEIDNNDEIDHVNDTLRPEKLDLCPFVRHLLQDCDSLPCDLAEKLIPTNSNSSEIMKIGQFFELFLLKRGKLSTFPSRFNAVGTIFQLINDQNLDIENFINVINDTHLERVQEKEKLSALNQIIVIRNYIIRMTNYFFDNSIICTSDFGLNLNRNLKLSKLDLSLFIGYSANIYNIGQIEEKFPNKIRHDTLNFLIGIQSKYQSCSYFECMMLQIFSFLTNSVNITPSISQIRERRDNEVMNLSVRYFVANLITIDNNKVISNFMKKMDELGNRKDLLFRMRDALDELSIIRKIEIFDRVLGEMRGLFPIDPKEGANIITPLNIALVCYTNPQKIYTNNLYLIYFYHYFFKSDLDQNYFPQINKLTSMQGIFQKISSEVENTT